MRTYVPSGPEIKREWWLVDADGQTLGRLASAVAQRLTGKHKPIYTPNLDTGDHVVVINAAKIVLTGTKLQDKIYRHHTGYPGGLREITAEKRLAKEPDALVEAAIWGMLPKGSLGRQMYRKLKVYAGNEHPHAAQQPRPLKFAGARAKRQAEPARTS
jgi:large subunit ribosomal protein L13